MSALRDPETCEHTHSCKHTCPCPQKHKHSGRYTDVHRHTRTQPQMVTHKRPHIATQTQIYTPAGTRTHTQAAPAQIHRSTCPGTHPAKGKRAQDTAHICTRSGSFAHTHLHSHKQLPSRLSAPAGQPLSLILSSGGPGPPWPAHPNCLYKFRPGAPFLHSQPAWTPAQPSLSAHSWQTPREQSAPASGMGKERGFRPPCAARRWPAPLQEVTETWSRSCG